MPVAFILDFEGGTTAQYDAIRGDSGFGDVLPPGALRHAAGSTDSGLRVVDVWESAEAFERFGQETLGPLSAKHGAPEPQVQSFEVGELMVGEDAEPTFVHVVTLAGVDADAFNAMAAQIMPGGAHPQGIVWHVNGPIAGGHRTIGAWVSREARDTFIATKIRPAMEAAGATTPPQIEDLPLHASMSTVARAAT
jgi:hypothetical protein